MVAVGDNRRVPEGMLVRQIVWDDIINKPGACGYSAHNDHREKDDPEECRSYFFQVRQEYRKKRACFFVTCCFIITYGGLSWGASGMSPICTLGVTISQRTFFILGLSEHFPAVWLI